MLQGGGEGGGRPLNKRTSVLMGHLKRNELLGSAIILVLWDPVHDYSLLVILCTDDKPSVRLYCILRDGKKSQCQVNHIKVS